jgi:uncharacterized HAD superfamily protein
MVDRTADFMLEEYKQIANAYQDLHTQQNELVKFYLALVAIPASVLAVGAQLLSAFENTASTGSGSASGAISTGGASNAINNPIMGSISTVGVPVVFALLIALCLVGVAVLLALVTTRAEALLYVRTVNSVRRYFVEHDPSGRLNRYLSLPHIDTVPRYKEGPGTRPFWNVATVAVLNGAVQFVTLWFLAQLLGVVATYGVVCTSVLCFVLVLVIGLVEIICCGLLLNTAEKGYRANFPDSLIEGNGRLIGIDLDGVLGDLLSEMIKVVEARYDLKLEREKVTCYRLDQCTPLTQAQIKEVFSSTDIFCTMRPIADAAECVKRLRREGWIVYVVTDRFWHDPETDLTIAKRWLQQNGFEWDHLELVSGEDKVDYAKKHGITFFVEDNADTVKRLSRVCSSVYLLDWPYNQGYLPANVTRVSTWQVIVGEITRQAAPLA